MNTLGQRRSWARHGDRDIQRTIDQAKAKTAADEAAERTALREATKLANQPVPYTAEQLAAATHVRIDMGWRRIARISAKSVTAIEHNIAGNPERVRKPLSKILEVRTIKPLT